MSKKAVDPSICEIIKNYDENHHLDFQAFLSYYRNDLSKSSIIQYARYLQYIDFDPTAENPEPDIEVFEQQDKNFQLSDYKYWAVKKLRQTTDQDIDRDRWIYTTYLAIKRYLEAIGREELKKELPEPKEIKKPQNNKQTFRLSEEQIEKLISAADTEDLRLAIILMAYSGLRISEVLQLRPDFLEYQEERVEILLDPKYLKGREKIDTTDTAFLDKKYAPALKEHIKSTYKWGGRYKSLREDIADKNLKPRPIINLHPELKEKVTSDELFEKTFSQLHRERQKSNSTLKKTARRAGINKYDKVTCHTLRRSFIHQIQDTVGDLNRTSQLARHSEIESTRQYLELEKAEMAKTYDQVFLKK